MAVYDVTIPGEPLLWGCSKNADRGFVTGQAFARQYLIYVGRAASIGTGHTLRLNVDAVPAVTPVDTPPKVTRLSITPKRFKPMTKGRAVMPGGKGRGGARLKFTVNLPADMRFGIERRTTGRRVGRACVKITPANRGRKKCTRYIKVTALIVPGIRAGSSVLRLTGRRGQAEALPAGAYRLGATAFDGLGVRSKLVTATFGIKGSKKR